MVYFIPEACRPGGDRHWSVSNARLALHLYPLCKAADEKYIPPRILRRRRLRELLGQRSGSRGSSVVESLGSWASTVALIQQNQHDFDEGYGGDGDTEIGILAGSGEGDEGQFYETDSGIFAHESVDSDSTAGFFVR